MDEHPQPFWRAHPVISGILVTCTVAGTIAAPFLLSEEWSLLRKLLAGALAGGGTGFLITATKLFD
jgi:hypothetical protein